MYAIAQLPSPSDIWVFLVIIFCGVFLFVLIALMVAQVPGGWSSFAKRYPAESRPAGNAYSVLNCWWWDRSFSRYIYDRARGLRVIFTDAGIYFYRMSLSRVGHPPFLLPWESARSVQKGHGVFRNFYVLEIEDAAGKFRLKLPERIEHDLARYQKAT